MKCTFIITSTINTDFGVVDKPTRYIETLDTIESIKSKVPDAKIMLVDSSIEEMTQEQQDYLKSKVDQFITLFNHYPVKDLNSKGLKSPGETYIMMVALSALEQLNWKSDRVFKISGRYKLSDSFDINEYDEKVKGKYVFKAKVKSWISDKAYLLDTRLWSFDSSLLSETIDMMPMIMETVLNTHFDLEHAYFQCVKEENIIGFEKVHVEGLCAGDGVYKYD